MSSPTVTTFDIPAIDVVLDMQKGWVLDFVDRTFATFFLELGIDIDKEFPEGSKAKRLRAFLLAAEPARAARVLEALLVRRGPREGDDTSKHLARYRDVIARLGGIRVLGLPDVNADVLSLDYVQELQRKTDQRVAASDLEGAITTARTALEAVLLELERRLTDVPSNHAGDLQVLFKSVAKKLRIDEERKDLDDNFKQVVRGLVQVVNGLAPIRNRMSDGHPRVRQPAPHHARVIVNAARTVATFLVESYIFQRERGTLR